MGNTSQQYYPRPWCERAIVSFFRRRGRDYDIEIEGLKRETLRAQEEHEGLIAIRDRLESSRVFVEEQLAKTKVSRQANGRGLHFSAREFSIRRGFLLAFFLVITFAFQLNS